LKPLFPASLACALLLSCGEDRFAGGSSSETSNGLTIQVVDAAGNPAARTRLRLRPQEYLEGASPATSNPGVGIIDTITDDSGKVRFPQGIPAMRLEAFGSSGSVQAGIDSGKRGIVVRLAPVGSVHGRVGLQPGDGPARIQARGLEHAVWTDSTGAFSMDSLPAGQIRLRAWVPRSLFSVESAFTLPAGGRLDVGSLVPLREAGRWTDSVRIVLNTLGGGGAIAAQVDSIPILVRLDGADFPAASRPGGADLRVVDSSGNALPFSVAFWSSSSLAAHFWVLVPAVRARDSAQWFRVRWGNPSGEDASAPWSVFASSSGWSGAWDFNRTYLDRRGARHVADASSWGDDGLLTGTPSPDAVDGLLFKGGGKDGMAASGVGTNLHGNFTVLIRARPENPGASFLLRGDSVWNHNKKAFYLGAAASAKIIHRPGWYPTFMAFADTTHNIYSVSNTGVDSSAWTFLVARHTLGAGDSGVVDWFVEGNRVASTQSGGTRFESDDFLHDSLIVGWRTLEAERFRGAMAEIWILGRAVGDDWVKLQSECRKDGGGTLVRIRR